MEENVISTIKVVVRVFHPGLPTLRMIDHVVDALQGKLKLRCKSWVIQKSYILIVVPSNKCSIQFGEVSLSLCGEICLSISSFWLWRVDAIIVNETPMNLFLTMSSGDWSC